MVIKRRTTMTSQMVRANNVGIVPLTRTPTMARRKSKVLSNGGSSSSIPAKLADLVSVLENGCSRIAVGHIVEALPVYVDPAEGLVGEYFLGEIVAIRSMGSAIISSTESHASKLLYYVHFLGQEAKFDDWLPFSRLRIIPSHRLEERLRELNASHQTSAVSVSTPESSSVVNTFFTLSSFSATASPVHPRFHIKSIRGIQLGNQAVLKAWYPSPYPEMIACPNSYIKVCDTCLCYFRSTEELSRHWKYCLFNHPPGTEIYRHNISDPSLLSPKPPSSTMTLSNSAFLSNWSATINEVSVFEIDGEIHNGYCERLLLLAKLFLAEKRACGKDASQYAQVRTFHFYVLCRWRPEDGRAELVGYFSKLKNNLRESHILSCILVLPHMQRRGYGNFLIDLAYELARIEGRNGSAERPLSELGQLSFYPYWLKKILPVLERMASTRNDVVISEIAKDSGIVIEDVLETMKHFGLIKEWGHAGVVVLASADVFSTTRGTSPTKNGSLKLKFNAKCLNWTPLYNFLDGGQK